MQGKDFLLPDRGRTPSLFAAGCLFFTAVAGKLVSDVITAGLLHLFGLFAGKLSPQFQQSLTEGVYYLLFLAYPFALYVHKHPGTGEKIRVCPMKRRYSILIPVAAAIGVMLVLTVTNLWCALIEAIGGTIPVSESSIPDTAGGLMGTILTRAVLPGICEELLFHGVLMSSLEERGTNRAIVVSAFFFMLAHSSVAGMPAEFLCALVIGFLITRTGSLFAGILYHIMHNAATLLLQYSLQFRDNGFLLPRWTFPVIVIAGILYALFLFSVGKRADKQGLTKRREGAQHPWYEYAVLSCGVLCALVLYANGFLKVVGLL